MVFRFELLQVKESGLAGILSGIAASSQAPYLSSRRKRQASLIPPLLLSPQNPLRWAFAGSPLLEELGDTKNAPGAIRPGRVWCLLISAG